MKKMLCASVVVMAVFVLAACGGNGGAATAQHTEDGAIELRVAWWGSQVRHDRTMQVIDMFMEQYPHISIQAEFYDYPSYWTVLNPLVAAGDVWDVFQLAARFPEYRENILPLNEFVDRGIIDISSTTQDFVEITTDNGDIVGISNGVNALSFAYDPAIFELAGLSAPNYLWTWEEFEAKAIAIQENLGILGMSNFGTNPAVALNQHLFQQGINFYSPNPAQLGFDDYTVLAPFFEMWRNLVQSGGAIDPGAAMTLTDVEGEPLVVGDAAMAFIASNQFIALANTAREFDPNRELRMINLPGHGHENGATTNIVSSQMFSISTDSAHPEEAAMFINFFQNNIEANRILQGERGVPIMQHVRDVLEAEADDVVAETYSFISLVGSLSEGMGIVLGNPSQGEVEDVLRLLMDQVVFDIITPLEAARELFDFASNAVAQN